VTFLCLHLHASLILDTPPQEEVVEVIEVIGSLTTSPAILERVGARRASRKVKRTAVRSQSEEYDKDGDRGGKRGRGDGRGCDDEVREGYEEEEEEVVGGVRRVHSELKISAVEANGSYDKLHF
jgi:hypothetical protein